MLRQRRCTAGRYSCEVGANICAHILSRVLMWLGHGRRGIMICCRTARMVGGNYDKVRLSIETDRGTPTPLPITTPYSALTVGNREQHTTITLMEPPYGWARPTPSVPHQLQCSIGFRPRATAQCSIGLQPRATANTPTLPPHARTRTPIARRYIQFVQLTYLRASNRERLCRRPLKEDRLCRTLPGFRLLHESRRRRRLRQGQRSCHKLLLRGGCD